MTVGTPIVLDFDRPKPKIPSIGYVKKSVEVFEAEPNANGKVKPAKATVSLTTTPLTEPVPYVRLNKFFVICKVSELASPKVLCARHAGVVQSEPMAQVFAAPVSTSIYIVLPPEPNLTAEK